MKNFFGNDMLVFTEDANEPTDMTIYQLDSSNFQQVGSQYLDNFVMGPSLNPLDGDLYGLIRTFSPNVVSVGKLDSSFTLTDLGMPIGMPNNAAGFYPSAAISQDGFMYFPVMGTSDLHTIELYTVDLRPSSPTYFELVDPTNGYVATTTGVTINSPDNILMAGITVGLDGLIYGVKFSPPNDNLIVIDPTTLQVTLVPITWPAALPNGTIFLGITVDNNGDFYAVGLTTGQLYKITISDTSATAELLTTLALNLLYTNIVLDPTAGDILSNQAQFDIEACDGEEPVTIQSNRENTEIVDLVVDKQSNCPIAFVGGTITYCVTATNPSSYEFPATFRDLLDPRLTYVTGTFTVDGTPQTPTITGQQISYELTIPANESVVICFKARVNY